MVLLVLSVLSLLWFMHALDTLSPESVHSLKFLLVTGKQLFFVTVIAAAITIFTFQVLDGIHLKHISLLRLRQPCAETVQQAEVDLKKEGRVPRNSI